MRWWRRVRMPSRSGDAGGHDVGEGAVPHQKLPEILLVHGGWVRGRFEGHYEAAKKATLASSAGIDPGRMRDARVFEAEIVRAIVRDAKACAPPELDDATTARALVQPKVRTAYIETRSTATDVPRVHEVVLEDLVITEWESRELVDEGTLTRGVVRGVAFARVLPVTKSYGFLGWLLFALGIVLPLLVLLWLLSRTACVDVDVVGTLRALEEPNAPSFFDGWLDDGAGDDGDGQGAAQGGGDGSGSSRGSGNGDGVRDDETGDGAGTGEGDVEDGRALQEGGRGSGNRGDEARDGRGDIDDGDGDGVARGQGGGGGGGGDGAGKRDDEGGAEATDTVEDRTKRHFTVDEALADPQAFFARCGQPLDVSGDVLFDFDRSTLRPDARAELKKVKALLSRASEEGLSLLVVGHTDARGKERHNFALSKRRASSVAAWLTTNRVVPRSRVAVRGVADREPVVPQDAPDEEQHKNRRVEIQVACPNTEGSR